MGKKNPTVSVILASYQHADYVEQAVMSVLNQKFEDLELIIVDDGSTDGTPDKIESFDDSRINLIRLGENRLENARNVGIENCRGKYIAFQNSDDVWLPEKLERQVEKLDQLPDTGAVFTQIEIIDAEGKPDKHHLLNQKFNEKNRSSSEWLREFYFNGNCLCITSAIVRKSCIDKVGGFRPSLVQVGDLDLWIRIASIAELHIMDQVLTRMRVIGKNNLSLDPVNKNRLVHEVAQVFERYGEPEILSRLSRIFPNISKKYSNVDPVLCFAALLKYSLTLNSKPHRLFTDRMIARILDDPSQRKLIIKKFGAKFVRDFFDSRNQMAVTIDRKPA